jgi:hypothetical protein
MSSILDFLLCPLSFDIPTALSDEQQQGTQLNNMPPEGTISTFILSQYMFSQVEGG